MLTEFIVNNIIRDDIDNDIMAIFHKKIVENGFRVLMASYDGDNERITFDIIIDDSDNRQESEIADIKNNIRKDVLTNYNFKSKSPY